MSTSLTIIFRYSNFIILSPKQKCLTSLQLKNYPASKQKVIISFLKSIETHNFVMQIREWRIWEEVIQKMMDDPEDGKFFIANYNYNASSERPSL